MNDLISRQAAINAIREHFKKSPTTAIRAMGVIESLPSAEHKKGKWLEKKVTHIDELEAKDIITGWQSAKCSVCGKYHTTPYMYYFDEYKCCPNCGAYLQEKRERK